MLWARASRPEPVSLCRDDDDINEDGWWRWTCHFCACMRRCAIDLHGSWFLYFIPAGADPCGSSLLRCWSIGSWCTNASEAVVGFNYFEWPW
jgi:hypothetical protein